MNRFERKPMPAIKYLAKLIPIAFFFVLFVVFIRGINSVSETTQAKQKESLETALEHSVAQCYAVEGSYPADLDYLIDHYGLTYDHDLFMVNYTFYGSNVYPEYIVLYRTGIVMIN